ncbi:MAG: hypothetical protein Q4F97_01085 [Bacteroidales bacterium]|nr:hypothetical protein [Bacteroidales bacterium]
MRNQEFNSTDEIIYVFKKFVKLKLKYLKLDVLEKSTILLGQIFLVLIAIILGCFALLSLSFAFAYLLGNILGSFVYGFLIITLFFLLIIFIITKWKDAIIINPILRMLENIIMKEEDELEEKEAEEQIKKEKDETAITHLS